LAGTGGAITPSSSGMQRNSSFSSLRDNIDCRPRVGASARAFGLALHVRQRRRCRGYSRSIVRAAVAIAPSLVYDGPSMDRGRG
jgi:hypothetical protein